ncbi:unnamed protein product (macronuclear) [Paramecium tetraurelia]|uniref:RING-type E3 ubiquitin transferase n=1 Tax=Paramecium tetraurelia TaxID=5888 RepID=A0C261_PARTE|nr:uncharacterized protein GSPATT00034355001 [Paramecium tetraurelia]CAK64878.1 unnamed protein product [Paramecium tetraurelia]|eukprot:XP_001432275.1 hypothetical protein (macronuclear) [Paramecium tetraurelia strain d4-2]
MQPFQLALVAYNITFAVLLIINIFCSDSLVFQLSYAFVLFPQVIHNIRWNCKENFNLFYIFGYLSSGLLFQTYLNSYSIQTNSIDIDYLYISLFYIIYFTSLLLLYLQYKFGSRCFIPKCILHKHISICAICLDSIAIADMEDRLQLLPVILTSCKHKFHEKCLRKWLHEKKECPFSRTNLNEMNLQIIN